MEKPINTAALTQWVGAIPEDVKAEMDQIAPMLRPLGYDPFGNPPNYGTPDKSVFEASKGIEHKQLAWKGDRSKESVKKPPWGTNHRTL